MALSFLKRWSCTLFTRNFPLSSGPVPLNIPSYVFHRVKAQISLDSLLASDQPVHASNIFLHNTLLRQHYVNHFPESLTCSYLQFRTSNSAKDCQNYFSLAAAWIIDLQLSTLNQRLATVLPSRSTVPFAIQQRSAPLRTASTSSSVKVTPAPSSWTLRSSYPQLLLSLSCLPVLFRPVRLRLFTQKLFRFRKTAYVPAQFTFQSIDRFLLAVLCICITCVLFFNLNCALYLCFQ